MYKCWRAETRLEREYSKHCSTISHCCYQTGLHLLSLSLSSVYDGSNPPSPLLHPPSNGCVSLIGPVAEAVGVIVCVYECMSLCSRHCEQAVSAVTHQPPSCLQAVLHLTSTPYLQAHVTPYSLSRYYLLPKTGK